MLKMFFFAQRVPVMRSCNMDFLNRTSGLFNHEMSCAKWCIILLCNRFSSVNLTPRKENH